ncbi:OmpP1/FadL family transporter [Formosa sp. A9]|uniref:OmpP1/FadL family transporter n=1 Tax=Formosa sp. A9 TaxID=3442641 RepID=UPI003EC10068
MKLKTLAFYIAGIFCMPAFYAQNITDAVRYSADNIEGTARYRALSGAFTALGGDLSASSLNPAGSAIFNSTYTSFSLSSLNTKNKTDYFNNHNSNSNSNTEFTQIGAAFVFYSPNTTNNFNKFSFGISYDKTQDFTNDWTVNGINTNSIDSYFLANAQGLRLDEISARSNETITQAYSEIGRIYGTRHQQAFLGYQSYILEPMEDVDENTEYTSNIAPGTFNQQYAYAATGYNGKIAVNFASEVNSKLYLGVNLNTHFISYDKYTYLNERNSNTNTLVNHVIFENTLSTIGGGFSFQLGGIYKATENLRLGLTYNSPTWYTISEETTQGVTTVRNENSTAVTQIVEPRVANIYPDYKLQTPGKINAGIAYIFGYSGLISLDYSYKDYSNAKFKPTNDIYFSEQNNIINNNLKGASAIAIGGEYRLKQLSLRGGYRFEESPYKNGNTIGDLSGYSVGLGYSFGVTKIDITFDQSQRDNNYQLYSVGLTDTASIQTRNSNVTCSLSFAL